MAKTQRWRRGRSAGEDSAPATDVPAEASETGPDDVDPTDPTDAPEAATPADPADDETAPDADVDADVDADLGADLEADLEADLDPDQETGLEEIDELEEIEDDELDDGTAERAAVPPLADRTGLVGWLFAGRSPAEVVPIQLLQAAHAKQAVTTALVMGLAAAVAGRPAREAGVVLITVLIGQTVLGWHNDIVDRQRDQAHGLKGKPLAMGRLQPETVWYAIVVATLLLVPLAITTGIRAGCLYLAAVAVGMLGNVLLRTGFFSWWSWAASYALFPAYLSYGGWGGQAIGNPPETSIVVLAALLGVGIHFLRSVWGLVADHEDGWTYLPLKLGLKLGATRLLALSTLYTAVIAILIVVMGAKVGLSR